MDELIILDSIQLASSKLGIPIENVRNEQRDALIGFLKKKDVFVGLPTGYGKSLIFQAAPIALDFMYSVKNNVSNSSTRANNTTSSSNSSDSVSGSNSASCSTESEATSTTLRSIVIIVSPLISLMKDQVTYLSEKGLNAFHLVGTSSAEQKQKLEIGYYNYIFTSPEQLFKQGLALVKKIPYKQNLVGIFIDESHCVAKWGLGSTKTQAFRSSYGRLGEVRSHLAKRIPIVALTATASLVVRNMIEEKINLENPVSIIKSPEKKNIRYSVIKPPPKQDLDAIFAPLVEELKKKGKEMERIIIFCRSHRHCRELYALFSHHCPEFQHTIAMYHSTTEDSIKDRVAKSFGVSTGEIRLLFATVAFGLGIDVKGVNTIVHLGPPSDTDDYCQESGRCGRDGSQSYAILINYSGSSGRYKTSSDMKLYSNNEEKCRRELILQPFGYKPTIHPNETPHLCCDICARKCLCEGDSCGDQKNGRSHVEEMLSSPTFSTGQSRIASIRLVDEEQKESLRLKLENFRGSLCTGKTLLSGEDLASGFPKSLVGDIVKEVNYITGVNYLRAQFPLLNLQHAIKVMKIINSTLTHISNEGIFAELTLSEGVCSEASSLSDFREINILSDSSDTD